MTIVNGKGKNMFDAEKRTLELLLKGNRVGSYIHTNYQFNIDSVWYIRGGVAYRPNQDFINPDMFPDGKKPLWDSMGRVIDGYRDNPHYFVIPQKPELCGKTKLIPMLPDGDVSDVGLKYVPYVDIKPWLGKKWRYVYIPEECSWKGGVFLILREDHPFPEAFITPFRKDR